MLGFSILVGESTHWECWVVVVVVVEAVGSGRWWQSIVERSVSSVEDVEPRRLGFGLRRMHCCGEGLLFCPL